MNNFNENSIEEELHIKPPDCCKQDITIYQLFSRYKINVVEISKYFGQRKELAPIEWKVGENEYYFECNNIFDPSCGEKCKDKKNKVITKLEFEGGNINYPAQITEDNQVYINDIIVNEGDNIKIDDIPGIPKILNLKNQRIVKFIDYQTLENKNKLDNLFRNDKVVLDKGSGHDIDSNTLKKGASEMILINQGLKPKLDSKSEVILKLVLEEPMKIFSKIVDTFSPFYELAYDKVKFEEMFVRRYHGFKYGYLHFDINYSRIRAKENLDKLLKTHTGNSDKLLSNKVERTKEKIDLFKKFTENIEIANINPDIHNGFTTFGEAPTPGTKISLNLNAFDKISDDGRRIRMFRETIIHEFMHLAGYPHRDRIHDDYVGDGGEYFESAVLRSHKCIARSDFISFDSIDCKGSNNNFTTRGNI